MTITVKHNIRFFMDRNRDVLLNWGLTTYGSSITVLKMLVEKTLLSLCASRCLFFSLRIPLGLAAGFESL